MGNGHIESFSFKLRDEPLNEEDIRYTDLGKNIDSALVVRLQSSTIAHHSQTLSTYSLAYYTAITNLGGLSFTCERSLTKWDLIRLIRKIPHRFGRLHLNKIGMCLLSSRIETLYLC